MEDEVIVRVGGEGGDLTLHGQRNGRGWRFSLNLFDQTMSWVDDGPVTERTSEVVETWPKALKLLDEYPWHQLYPLTVHPEFRSKVLKAVLSRNIRDHDDYGADHWHEVCGLPKLDELKIEMDFQKIQIPKFGSTQGQLLAANPSFSKPSNITKEQFDTAVADTKENCPISKLYNTKITAEATLS